MALITCSVCGKQFSDRAEKCPQCGSLALANSQVKKAICIAALALFVSCLLFVLYSIIKYFQYEEYYYFYYEWWFLSFTKIWYYINLFISLLVIIYFYWLQRKSSPQKAIYRRITSYGCIFSSLACIFIILSLSLRDILAGDVELINLGYNLWTLLLGITTFTYGMKLANPFKYLVIVVGIALIGIITYYWRDLVVFDPYLSHSLVILRMVLLPLTIAVYMLFVTMIYNNNHILPASFNFKLMTPYGTN